MKAFFKALAVFPAVFLAGIVLSAIVFPGAYTPGWFIGLTFLAAVAAAAAVLVKSAGRARASRRNLQEAEGPRPVFSGHFFHVSGLDLPPDTKCLVSYYPDELAFSALGHTFTVAHSKVRAVTKATREDIQRQYVSSAGGAVAGAMLFGPLGAALGGRAKQKAVRDATHYLLIAYGDPGEGPKYIVLRLTEWGSDGRRFVDAYKRQTGGAQTRIEL